MGRRKRAFMISDLAHLPVIFRVMARRAWQ